MDMLERWFRNNIDDNTPREVLIEEARVAREQQLEGFCQDARRAEIRAAREECDRNGWW